MGFKNIHFFDKSEEVKRSSFGIYMRGILFYHTALFLSWFGLVPKNIMGTFLAAINQRRLAKKNIVKYGIFVADK